MCNRWRALSTAVSTLFVLACLRPQLATQERLVGSWKGEPYSSQFGTSVNRICFRSDGTMESVVETQAGPVTATGTYSVSGDTLSLRIVDAVENPQTAKVSVTGDTLTLVYGQDEVKYRRIAAKCEP